MLRFCVIFGTKLGGVLLFRVSFEKDVWLLVSRLGGWLMAQQEQQQRRNSKSSSISSCLRPSLLWCFPVRDPRFCSSQQAASTIYSLGFSGNSLSQQQSTAASTSQQQAGAGSSRQQQGQEQAAAGSSRQQQGAASSSQQQPAAASTSQQQAAKFQPFTFIF